MAADALRQSEPHLGNEIMVAPSPTPGLASVLSMDTDRELALRVSNVLAERHVPSLRRLEIEVHEGVVTVRGRVRTFYEKQLCQEACRNLAGAVQWVDAIDVLPPTAVSSYRG